MNKTLVSVREAAASWSVSPDAVWKQIRAGRVKTVRVARRVLIPTSEVERVAREGCNVTVENEATATA